MEAERLSLFFCFLLSIILLFTSIYLGDWQFALGYVSAIVFCIIVALKMKLRRCNS